MNTKISDHNKDQNVAFVEETAFVTILITTLLYSNTKLMCALAGMWRNGRNITNEVGDLFAARHKLLEHGFGV